MEESAGAFDEAFDSVDIEGVIEGEHGRGVVNFFESVERDRGRSDILRGAMGIDDVGVAFFYFEEFLHESVEIGIGNLGCIEGVVEVVVLSNILAEFLVLCFYFLGYGIWRGLREEVVIFGGGIHGLGIVVLVFLIFSEGDSVESPKDDDEDGEGEPSDGVEEVIIGNVWSPWSWYGIFPRALGKFFDEVGLGIEFDIEFFLYVVGVESEEGVGGGCVMG